MANLLVFPTLADALRAGFQVYDRVSDGYLVKAHTRAGLAMAFVPNEHPTVTK
jgi:hypothetical protein